MPKLPILSTRELIKVLVKAGFDYAPQRGKGSHLAFVKSEKDDTRLVIIPDRKEIPRGTLLSTLEQSGISKEELIRLLRD